MQYYWYEHNIVSFINKFWPHLGKEYMLPT